MAPAHLHLTFIPGGSNEQMSWLDDLQRVTGVAGECGADSRAMDVSDVSDLLPQVKVPTVVMHCRNDAVIPFDEGRRLAAGIPGARFVALETDNHVILENEPAWPRFLNEVRGFLKS